MIKIILPELGTKPIGGFKIILDYANYLCRKGEVVAIIYSSYVSRLRQTKIISVARRIKGLYRYAKGITLGYSCTKWFALDSKIKEYLVYSPKSIKIDTNDIIIATSATTEPYICKSQAKRCFYFIQGFEYWNCTKDDLMKTYLSSSKNIVVSTWLNKFLESIGATSCFIPNGYDLETFKVTCSISTRSPYKILSMYHPSREKGFEDALKAVSIAKERFPQIELTVFGAQKSTKRLPEWCTFILRPKLKELVELYNAAAIYVAASWNEGWGLTIGESMLCGCAVVCTDNAGYREMASNGRTALVSEIMNPKELGDNIIRLITNTHLRLNIAHAANTEIRKYNVSNSRQMFYDKIMGIK